VVWYPTAASGSDDPVYKAIVDAPLDVRPDRIRS
jgi:hypothetical protein